MRILHVTPFIEAEPQLGGVPVAVRLIVEGLKDSGCDVLVLTSDWGPPTQIRDVEVIRARSPFVRLGALLNTPITPSTLFVDPNRLGKVDLIHMHGMWTFGNLAGYILARRLRVPYVLQAHGSLHPRHVKRPDKRIYLLLFGWRLIRHASALLALGPEESTAFEDLGANPKRIFVVPNPSHSPPPREAKDAEPDSTPREEDAAPAIGYLGRLHRSKHVDLLLRSLRQLILAGHEITGKIAGPDDGALRPLQRLADSLGLTDRVEFCGELSDTARWNFLRSVDLLVIPAFAGLPMTALEAMAIGTPVMTTDLADAGHSSITSALYITRSDPPSLAEGIWYLLENPEVLRRMVAKGAALVSTEMSARSVAASLIEIYRGLVEG